MEAALRPRTVSPVIGAALIVVALLAMFLATLIANRVADSRREELAEELSPLEAALTDTEIEVLAASTEARAYVATADGAYRTRYEELSQALIASVVELEQTAEGTTFAPAAQRIAASTEAWTPVMDDTVELRRDGDQAAAEALLDERVVPERDAIVAEADAMRADVRARIQTLRNDINEVERAEEVVLAAAGLTGLIAAAVLVWLLISNRRLEARLESERRRAQEVINDVPGVVWEAWGQPDLKNQRIDYVSPFVEEMLGYRTDEWLETPNFWLSIVHPDDRERAGAEAAAIFNGGQGGIIEFRWVAKDGRVVPVVAYSTVIYDASGKPAGMRGVTLDVTERKRAEEALAFIAEAGRVLSSSLEYESTLQTVARLAVPQVADWCAVHVANEDGVAEQVAVAHVNPSKVDWALELQRRYPAAPEAKRGVPQVIRTGEPEIVEVITDEMVQGLARDEEQLRILREVGFSSYLCVPMTARGRTLGAITLVQAESGRHFGAPDMELAQQLGRRAAMAVDNARLYRHAQAEQARFSSIVASVDYGVLQADAQGRVVYANPATEALLGSEPVRRTIHELVHSGEDAGGHAPAECRLMEVAQGAEAYRGEDVFTGADGSPLSVEVSLAPVVIDGEGAGAVLVFQDIGERLRRERMKDDYLAFASHELRSPLTSVIGMAKWLAKHVGDGRAELDDDARDAMETLEGEADRMASIVELFLDLSRIESDRVALELDQVDLRELIDEEAISFAARHPEVRLETACPEGPLAVVSDRVRIRQVVTNLLENAAKYGGDPPRAAISLTPEGAHAVIRVSDNGRGIPPDEQPHIFERFYRGSTADEGSKKGLGVGLFISSEIVHRLGGRITFRTGAKGTEFSVSLPLGEATQPAALRPAGGRQG